MTVAIAPGNHDFICSGSPYLNCDWGKRVKILTGQPVQLENLPVTLWGAAFHGSYQTQSLLEGVRLEPDGRLHIGVLHGDLVSDRGQSNYDPLPPVADCPKRPALSGVGSYPPAQRASQSRYHRLLLLRCAGRIWFWRTGRIGRFDLGSVGIWYSVGICAPLPENVSAAHHSGDRFGSAPSGDPSGAASVRTAVWQGLSPAFLPAGFDRGNGPAVRILPSGCRPVWRKLCTGCRWRIRPCRMPIRFW